MFNRVPNTFLLRPSPRTWIWRGVNGGNPKDIDSDNRYY